MFCSQCGQENDEAARFCGSCGAALPARGQAPPVQRAPGIAAAVEYAGFWKRFAALIIDNIVMFVATFVGGFLLGLFVGLAGGGEDAAGVLGFIVGIGLPWLYWSLMESSSKQATLGKMALGIIVTDVEGNRTSFWRATGRYWAKIVSTLILFIGFFMAGFTEKKQALHDMIASCLVVVKR